jgi:uncharacterized protein YjdB
VIQVRWNELHSYPAKIKKKRRYDEMKRTRKTFKAFSAMLAVLLLAVSLPVASFAASDNQSITGDSTVDDVTLEVTVPMNLNFALDPLELNVTSGSQVATADYFFVNRTAAPVKVAVNLTAVVTNGAVLVDDPDTLSPYDTEVTTKEIYFAALGATSITVNDLDFDYVTTEGAIAPAGTYDATSSALTYFDSADKKANIAFALDKATNVETDGTPTTGAALALNDKGAATFQFFSKMNTYADWQPNDIKITGNYTLTALSATTYSNYTTNNSYEADGFNQLKVNRPVTALTVTSSAITVVAGDTLTMSAIALPSNATDKTVTWSVADDTGSATITTSSGILTAVSPGAVTVTATANDGSGVTGSLQITITAAPVSVTGITVSGAAGATTVTSGSTLQMSAAVLPANATDNSVTWSVTNGTGSATITTSGGLLTATGVGTVTVTATANDGSGITGTLQITINPVYSAAGFIVTGSSVTLTSLTSASAITSSKADATDLSIPFYFNGLTIKSMTVNGSVTVPSADYGISGNNLVIYKSSPTNVFRTYSATLKTVVMTLTNGTTDSTYTFYINVTN